MLRRSDLSPQRLERETFWWCFKRQVSVVGGWPKALNPFTLPLVWGSARELQAEIRADHDRYYQP